MTRLLLLFGTLFLVLPAALRAQGADSAPGIIQPGDRVNIVVWRNAELSGTYTVGQDSALVHPLYGAVRVAGLPPSVAQERVRDFLTRFEVDPKVTFTPEYRVFVGGEVRNPNQHFFPEMTLGQAIVQAGGSTTPNRTQRVRFIRGGEHTVVNLDDDRIAALLQEPIRSGDQVIVEERPTFTRTYVRPALQVIQTAASLITTFVLITSVLDSDDGDAGSGSQ